MTNRRKTIFPLTEKQFLNFLKFVTEDDGILAVQCFLEEVEEGKTIDEILEGEQTDTSVISFGNPDPYVINVTKLDKFKFKIFFGCFPDPTAGDSGTWEVSFDENENVTDAVMVGSTIS
ncbi:MAG TPA: hypothetical protein PKU78_04430 [Candidatus Dojkabacteria bacterium]|nr:hypothetical protein [Candidatus Dojkabacteria bacterium]HRO65440.1 hypothetical protein [Candidatus Dojkabacteria bacterium]HRP36259.1 hypothetical protein [Candidatus Dojkabacteria bacterium]HRP51105.1 hypothetical protein [Candidatus Dojkabacteria bacterium]